MARLGLPLMLAIILAYSAAMLLVVLGLGMYTQPPFLAGGAHTLTVDLTGAPREGLVGGQAYIFYPGGYLFQEVDPDSLRVQFRVPMGGIQERANTVEGRFRERGFVEHASLSVALYYVNPDGSLCVRRADFSTFDYYLNTKGGNPLEAYRLAANDPLALLRLSYIKIKPESLSECTPLAPAGDPGRLAVGGKPSGPIVPVSQLEHPAGLPRESGPRVACLQSLRAQVWFQSLYDIWYNDEDPPSLWVEKYEGDYHDAKTAWQMYAYRFAFAYYAPADECSPGDVIDTLKVYYVGFAPGVYPMDDFAYDLYSAVSYQGWNDTFDTDQVIEEYDAAPFMVLEVEWGDSGQPPSYPALTLSYSYIQYQSSKRGIGLLGVMVLGSSYSELRSSGIPSVSVVPSAYQGHSIGVIYGPLQVIYKFDAATVYYWVSKVYMNGTYWWRVIPLVRFTPYYDIHYTYSDLTSIVFSADQPPPLGSNLLSIYANLTTLANGEQPLDEYTIASTEIPPSGSEVVIESSRGGSTGGTNYGALLTYALNLAVTKIPKIREVFASDSPLASYSTLALAAVNIIWERFGLSFAEIKLSAQPIGGDTVSLVASKSTMPSWYRDDAFDDIGFVPALLKYKVTLSYPNSGPPCGMALC